MKKSKIFSLLLCLCMIFSFSFAFAAEDIMLTTAAPADILIAPAPANDITIIHTNDVHCGNYTDYAKIATLAKDADLLVDAGDAVQGGTLGALSKGAYVVEIMNEVGYDAAVIGNHEFDFGMDEFKALVKDAKYPFLSCNFVELATNKSIYDAYKVFEVKGKKIAIVGITTPETFVKSTPTFFQDANGKYIYGFCEGNDGKDLYKAVQSAVDAAKKEADVVVAVGHLGIDDESKPWTSTDVIKNTNGIDVFIDAHSHSTFVNEVKNKDGKKIVVAQTGTQLANAGKITIAEDGTISAELVALEGVEADADAAAFIETVTEKFDAVQKEVVAKTNVELTINDADGKRAVRNQETNLGDLCADAYRVLLGADISFVNGGGVRANIAKGDVTFGDIILVHPFGNMACLVEVTGQQIIDALELGASANPGEFGGFLQVSGLTYKINTAIPSSVVVNDKSEFVKVKGQRRVTEVMVGGEPIDVNKTYKLASHNYMLKSAGDGFAMFGSKNVKVLKDEVMVDNEVLINYIVDELNGVVGSEYAKPQGRITIYEDASEVITETKYTVVKGDCLWNIAVKELGNGYRWKEIYEANKDIIKSPSLILVGQELVIPAA